VADTLNDARVVAMRLLAMREHSTYEMRSKLNKKGFDDSDIGVVINEYKHLNYLNDERFTEVFINSHRKKGKGPSRIQKELQQHKIDTNFISMHLDIYDFDWIQCAENVRKKKFGKEIPDEYKEKMKQARFLEYRGFTNEQIFSVLKNDEMSC